MEEETNSKHVRTGLHMLELIERVKEKFKSEYNFKPTTTNITNLIAQRVNDNNLF